MNFPTKEAALKYFIFAFFLIDIYSVNADSVLVFQSDNYSIRWIDQINKSSDVESDKSVLVKLTDLIFGKNLKQFKSPVNILNLNKDCFFVLDQYSSSIYSIFREQGQFKTYRLRNLPSAVSMALLCPNRILITDSRLNRVFTLDIEEEDLIPFDFNKELEQPTGIVVIPKNKQIWITETAGHKISIFNYNGEFIKTVGKRGSAPGDFNFPTYLYYDNNDRIIINDAMNFRIQIIDTSGNIISTFGEAGSASGYLARPKGIACDSHGHLYIVDALYSNVQIFNSKGQLLAYFGRKGRKKGEFWMPTGISIDMEDNIYVADTYNSRVQIFRLEKKH